MFKPAAARNGKVIASCCRRSGGSQTSLGGSGGRSAALSEPRSGGTSIHHAGIAERVRWVGERDDVRRLLTAADVYCQPNVRPEPFGIVFVEALAAGLPVVTTRTGGAVEIVDHTCGLLLDGPDPAAVESALRRLIQDPPLRRRLANAAVQRAARFCDRDRHAAHLWSVLAHQPESIPA